MWAPLLLIGFLSGWWGALALAAAPPAIQDTLGETSATTSIIASHYRPPSMSAPGEAVREIPKYQTREEYPRSEYLWPEVRSAYRDKIVLTDPSPVNHADNENDALHASRYSSGRNVEPYQVPSSLARAEADEGPARNTLSAVAEQRVRAFHPKMDESGLTRAPRHSSTQTPFAYPPTAVAESSMERPRVARSAKQRPKNRTRADSPREQRRRCRNKDRCRGQNWCPDVDVGNRAYLAPTVFEGKARSMSSLRKPGSNYAVTFEVKQVYKSQPGFQPLQKNDSVRLHFRDKSAPGKSTVCNGHEAVAGSKGKQQRDNSSDVVRANIKRGKVYLVFVNRVGPRNFTILGEPVIRSKKNEQAVQAVVRPDYGESQQSCMAIYFPDIVRLRLVVSIMYR